MEQFVDIMKYFDSEIQNSVNEIERQNLLYEMFLIECKYNLDILDVIDYKNGTAEKEEIVEIINLLSFQGLLSALKFEKKSSSFITNKLTGIFKKHDSKNKDVIKYRNEDEKLMSLYKRIIVLKALSSISLNNYVIKKVNFKIRLINLKRLLLVIIKG